MATARRKTSPAASRKSSRPEKGPRARVELCRQGLRLVDAAGASEVLPLRAGAVHYWRLDPRSWRAALASLQTLELRLVETYVPWQVHEVPPVSGGEPSYHFDGALDVGAFLREAHALGLKAIVRPGPHINAELTDFGLPERVLWDPDCQARSPRGNPVMLPAPPRAFPVPSYGSRAFLDEATRWLSAVGAELRELVWPAGPIVLVQVDNEGSFYFRDGAYDQDYHPDAVSHYRGFLKSRYRTVRELRRAYGVGIESFDEVSPPVRYDARSAEDLPRHLDWAESHETLLGHAFSVMATALERSGLAGVPLFHNAPMAESATPLNPARLRRDPSAKGARGIDLLALDYYYRASDHRAIARRTSELAATCEGLGHPTFGAEMGAGAPPYFPPMDERDAAFTVLCAMAYGLRGYNVYMAVERDRWLGSPIDREGMPRPFSAFWRKLGAAFDRVRFAELSRDVPARIVVPRAVRRHSRVMHAFGPVSQSLFRLMGGGLRETVLEDDIDFGEGHGEAPAMRAARVLVAAERALTEEGIPFALVDGADAAHALGGARWIIVPTSCGVEPEVIEAVRAAQGGGAHVVFAPSPPRRDASFRPLPPKVQSALPTAHVIVGDDAVDSASMRAHLDAIAPDLPRIPGRPAPCAVTVHRDAEGQPRVVFLVNATKQRERVSALVPGVRTVRDLLDQTTHDLEDGVPVDAGTVRFCEILG